MIHRYIPEVYIGVTEDPVVCRRCFDSLNVHDNFIKTCLDVEKQTHNINNNKVAGFKPSNNFIKNGNDETELEKERQMKRLIKIEKELKTEEMLIKTEEIDLKSEGNDWESDSFLLGSHNETVQNKMRHIYKEEADIKREYMLKCETIEVQISKPEAALHTPYNSENKNELNGGLKEEAALDMCCKESSSCLQLISKTHLEQERINVMCLLTKLSTRVISECIS
ncbi:uncharacterized protein LOC108911842 [Anoplophora glabripennis]|uniref:uncharacterized protein LOC108911842 n=1 Tax=Anoplophora glabripennis TaxID=217634 RepID=UPI000874161B|nr:uncharacterized protein LOC108911842 [Anoplophora glabripennis]